MSESGPGTGEQVLYESHPSMFRNHPVQFVVLVLLSIALVGLPFLIAWWLQCKATTLTITNERTTLRKGLLSKFETDVYHENVRNVQIRQTFFQRIMDVGYIGISSAGQAGMEIEVNGIPNPDEVRRLIDQYREA